MPARRLAASRRAWVISPVVIGSYTASMMVRVPQATKAQRRIIG
jgi:hypothetical protein